jgi:hypothetical protein
LHGLTDPDAASELGHARLCQGKLPDSARLPDVIRQFGPPFVRNDSNSERFVGDFVPLSGSGGRIWVPHVPDRPPQTIDRPINNQVGYELRTPHNSPAQEHGFVAVFFGFCSNSTA